DPEHQRGRRLLADQALYEPLSGAEHDGRVLEGAASSARQAKLPTNPLEQRSAELSFELPDLLTDRRNADTQTRCGTADTAFARGDVEVIDVVVVKHTNNM